MITTKIAEFERLAADGKLDSNSSGSQASDTNDHVESLWNQLLMAFPSDPATALMLIDFFLGQIQQLPRQSERNAICQDKVRLLMKSLVPEAQEFDRLNGKRI